MLQKITILMILIPMISHFSACSLKRGTENTASGSNSNDLGKKQNSPESNTKPGKTAAEAPRTIANDGRRFLDLSQIPVEGKNPADFLQSGWRIEEQIEGDVNADAKPDLVIQLIEDMPALINDTVNDRYRALLILARSENGMLRRIGAADRLLFCTTCFGALAGPEGGSPVVKISNGVIIVHHLWGSNEATDLTQRFRYDAQPGRFVMIGEDYEEMDRGNGTSVRESSNYLTGVKIVEKFRIDREGQMVKVSTAKKSIPARKTFLEDIDYEKALTDE